MHRIDLYSKLMDIDFLPLEVLSNVKIYVELFPAPSMGISTSITHEATFYSPPALGTVSQLYRNILISNFWSLSHQFSRRKKYLTSTLFYLCNSLFLQSGSRCWGGRISIYHFCQNILLFSWSIYTGNFFTRGWI